MTIKNAFKAVALTSVLGLALAACGSSSDDNGKTGAGNELNLISSGTLTVCSDVPYAPFEDFDKSAPTGFKGFDVDIVSKIAEGLKLKLKYKDSAFEPLQSGQALNARQCDLVASALTITPDRTKNLGFTKGYYDSEQSLLVPTSSAIKGIGDLSGKKVGVQNATTGKTYATEHAKGAKIISFPSDAEMYAALKSGQVDALLQDLPVNLVHQNDAHQAGKFKVVEKYKTGEQYGLAARKTNTALIEAINSQLAALRSSGEYDTIYNRYFATS